MVDRTKDMTGLVFGDWTVIGKDKVNKGNRLWRWWCKCVCGKTESVDGGSLRRGQSKGCRSCSNTINGRKGLYTMSKGLPVYFIRSGDYVKIGASNDIEKRVYAIFTDNPHEVCLLDTDTDYDEEIWHSVFSHRIHRNEWYYFPSASGGCEAI